MRVKSLDQEHKAVPRQGLDWPGRLDPESSAQPLRPPPPISYSITVQLFSQESVVWKTDTSKFYQKTGLLCKQSINQSINQ